MADPKEIIGYIDCHICGEEVALKSSKKGKVYYNCGECGQVFVRTAKADKLLREKARKEAKNKDVSIPKKSDKGDGDHGGRKEDQDGGKKPGWFF